MLTTSEDKDFLSDIAKKFISFRKIISEEADEEESCLCEGCLRKCQSISNEKCSKSYDDFLCYVEDGKCKTEASRNFCHKCNTDETKLRKQFNVFQYQMFLEEYMKELNKIHPKEANSRGLLIYHGLGSGKTCSGLLVGEACKFYKGKARKMILMIPASLVLEPWIKELSGKCSKNPTLRKKLRDSIRKNKDKPDSEQKKIYKAICEKEGYYIVHYNAENITGGWRDALNKIPTRKGSDNPFDDSVIIIDEIHNLVNAIVNSKEGKNKISKVDIYNKIFFAKNAKVVLLTGTPIYNKPVELAYIFNMIRGYISERKNIKFETNEDVFNKLFLKSKGDKYEALNPNMFRRRINGLVSYYKGASEKQFARKVEENVYIPFEDSQQRDYETIRKLEAESMRDDTGKSGKNSSARIRQNTAMISNVHLPRFLFDKNLQKNYDSIPGNHIKKNGVPIPPRHIKERTLKNKTLPSMVAKEDYQNVIELLDNDFKPLHVDNDLHKISRKMYHAMKLIKKSRGPTIFYSQYEGLYGITLFAEAMKQNGYVDFDKLKGGRDEARRRKGLPEEDPEHIKGTYMLWTGNHAINATRKIYNSFENKDGSLIKCFLMTKAGKEGINLLGVRQIHILEPWWNDVINEQVIGRGVRMCSHNHIRKSDFTDLRIKQEEATDEQRLVNIYKYYGLPDLRPMEYMRSGTIKKSLIPMIKEAQKEMKRKSTDYHIYRIAERKKQKERVFLELMKDVAIDCFINAIINGREEEGCFVDENHQDYFESWNVRDNNLMEEDNNPTSGFKLIKINGKYYWKDRKNKVYDRKREEGNLLKPIRHLEYVSIGKLVNGEIKATYDNIKIDIGERDMKPELEMIVTDYLKNTMGYNLKSRKVLFISSRVNVLYELLNAGANVTIYDDYNDNVGKQIKEDMMNLSFKNKSFSKSKKGKYDLIYAEELEEDLNSDFIIVPNSFNIDSNSIVFKVRNIKGKFYLINKNEYRNELISDVAKYYKGDLSKIKEIPSDVNSYAELELLIRNERVPNALSNFKNSYVMRNSKNFLDEQVMEIYRDKNLSRENKKIIVDNNLFTFKKLQENIDLLGKAEILSLKTKKDLKKEKKKVKKIKSIISQIQIDGTIREMQALKKETTIDISKIKTTAPKKPKAKTVKKKRVKIGEACEEDKDCYSKKCEDKVCVSKTKKKSKKKKAPTKKKTDTKKKTTQKKSVRKAPTEPAKKHEEGFEKIGNDGNVYVVKIIKNGNKRWIKKKGQTTKKKTATKAKTQRKTKKKTTKPKTKRKTKKKTASKKKKKSTDVLAKKMKKDVKKIFKENKKDILEGKLTRKHIKRAIDKKYGKGTYKANKEIVKRYIEEEAAKLN